MAITYYAEGVKFPDIKKRVTNDWIKRVAASYGKKCGEIAYLFCSDEKILSVNNEYLHLIIIRISLLLIIRRMM